MALESHQAHVPGLEVVAQPHASHTDNPHVHIVIRGVDAEGKDLRINGRYIGQELRWRAQEIITRELGPRTELDAARERSKEITRNGFTLIDRMLTGHLSADNRLRPDRLAVAVRPERAACLARLAVLEQMGFARREARGTWRFESGWDHELRRMQVVSEARARLAHHVPGCFGAGHLLDTGQRFETVEGVVRGLGLHDELIGAMYVVVQRADGAAYYVPVRQEVASTTRPPTSASWRCSPDAALPRTRHPPSWWRPTCGDSSGSNDTV